MHESNYTIILRLLSQKKSHPVPLAYQHSTTTTTTTTTTTVDPCGPGRLLATFLCLLPLLLHPLMFENVSPLSQFRFLVIL